MKQNELELTGAASALKYLEMSVTRAQKRLDEAHEAFEYAQKCQRDKPDELDGEDFAILVTRARAEINDAESSLLRFSKSLLDYDRNVDTSRRDVSISISKSDAVKFGFSFAICMRGGVEQAAIRHAQEGVECKSREEMHMLVAPVLRKCLQSAIKSAIMEAQMPDWFGSAISDAL